MASTTNTLLKKIVNGKSLQRVLDSEAESFAEIPLPELLLSVDVPLLDK